MTQFKRNRSGAKRAMLTYLDALPIWEQTGVALFTRAELEAVVGRGSREQFKHLINEKLVTPVIVNKPKLNKQDELFSLSHQQKFRLNNITTEWERKDNYPEPRHPSPGNRWVLPPRTVAMAGINPLQHPGQVRSS